MLSIQEDPLTIDQKFILETAEAPPEDVEIAIALDGSASIGLAVFNGAVKNFANYLVNGLMVDAEQSQANVSVGLCVFDDASQIVCDLTRDRDLLNSSIKDMTYPGGLTNFTRPLTQCDEMLNNSPFPSENKKQIIVLVTDGHADDVSDLCRTLKANGKVVMMIGVGDGTNERALESFATPGCFYSYANFNVLKDDVNTLINKASTFSKQCDIQFSWNKLVDVGQNAFINVKITNNGGVPLKPSCMVFKSNGYFRKTHLFLKQGIQPQSSVEVEAELIVNGGASKFDLKKSCGKVEYSLEEMSSQHCVTTGSDAVYLCSAMFMRRIIEYKTKHECYIHLGLLGLVGSGKTATVNGLNRLFVMDESKIVAREGREEGTLTNKITNFLLTSFLNQKIATPLRLTDIWGIENDASQKKKIQFCKVILRKYLKGLLPLDFRPQQGTDIYQQLEQHQEVVKENVIDFLIFVIDVEKCDSSSVLKEIMGYAKEASDMGKEYIILVSHVDSLGDNKFWELFDPSNDTRQQVLEQLTNGEHGALDPKRIFFMSNKHENFRGSATENLFVKRLALFEILDFVYRNYDDAMDRMLNEDPSAEKDRFSESTPQNSSLPKRKQRKFVFQNEEGRKKPLPVSSDMTEEQLERMVREKFRPRLPSTSELTFVDDEGMALADGEDFFSNEEYGSKKHPILIEVEPPLYAE